MRLAFKIASLALTLATTFAAKLPEVTDLTYQSAVLNSPKYVLVEFVARGCDSCKSVEKRLEEIAPTYAAKLSIVKMDTATCQVNPSQFNIQEFPALVLFFDNAFKAGLSGDQSKSQIRTFLDNNLH
ncbi:hypothetical protein BG006_007324 [Podila minutissima]|uniref:Thioredoxin domain-containing protein n=1 Tax=Podila minutissima TaxID=64525 RepID=A0A9P5SSL3_9FUNG|nr:hypothetical protein BG006_007324 [Podila minutissima]